MSDLADKREEIADRIYEGFDFSYNVVDAHGWEWTEPGKEMQRTVFVEDPDDNSAPSIAGYLVVRFQDEGSAVPVEAYAVVRGQVVKSIAGAKLEDYVQPGTAPTP